MSTITITVSKEDTNITMRWLFLSIVNIPHDFVDNVRLIIRLESKHFNYSSCALHSCKSSKSFLKKGFWISKSSIKINQQPFTFRKSINFRDEDSFPKMLS